MDDLVKALAVPFVAGLIVQRFLELVDPVTAKFISDPNTKKIVLGFVSLGLGCALSGFADLRIFHLLHPLFPGIGELPGWLDVLVTGIFISAGTDGLNSLLKFVEHKKESSKPAAEKAPVPAAVLREVNA